MGKQLGTCDRSPSGEGEAGRYLFRLEGDCWTIGYDGRTVHLRDAKGMHYLALLLQCPGRTMAATELAAAAAAPRAHGLAPHPGRARVAVTKRIRDVIRKIAVHHPSLGYHLATAVKTGSTCVYRPDPAQPHPWRTYGRAD